jgi:hypothetical protein
MKAIFILTYLGIGTELLLFNSMQAQVVQKNLPYTKFNLHRQYDDKGNLIEYDSTTIFTWDSDSTKIIVDPNTEDWDVDAFKHRQDSSSGQNNTNDLFDFDFNNNELFDPAFS